MRDPMRHLVRRAREAKRDLKIYTGDGLHAAAHGCAQREFNEGRPAADSAGQMSDAPLTLLPTVLP